MRKNASFAIAATIIGLAMIFWAKSSVTATSADVVRPQGWVVICCRHAQPIPADSGGRSDLVISLGHEATN
jgi:hypothetical protein